MEYDDDDDGDDDDDDDDDEDMRSHLRDTGSSVADKPVTQTVSRTSLSTECLSAEPFNQKSVSLSQACERASDNGDATP